MTHRLRLTLAQVPIEEKSNEIPAFPRLLRDLPKVDYALVTADPMHCQQESARGTTQELGWDYLFGLKDNQSGILPLPGGSISLPLLFPLIHAIHVSMQKIQILFPDPDMALLRETAEAMDRSISDIVRTATEAWLLSRPRLARKRVRQEVPVFRGGETRIGAETMREIAWEDRNRV